jgi:hypothetical protein
MKRKGWYILLLIFIVSDSFAVSQTEAEEYKLKAAFMYNFTNFIEWAPDPSADVFIIGVLGPSLIIDPLTEIAKTKKVNNKRIVIKEFSSPEELTFCNILFISQKTSFPMDLILNKVLFKNTLVVSEKNGSAAQGACINFVVVNDKLKFETNLTALNSTGLKVSSQLLKLAIIVN